MQPTSRSPFVVAGIALSALLLAGCGDTLIGKLANFWSLGACGILLVILDVLALVEIAGSNRSGGDKLLWAAIIIIFPFVGLLLYWFIGRK